MLIRHQVNLFFDHEEEALRRMDYLVHEGNYENVSILGVKGGENDGRFLLTATRLEYKKERA